MCDFYFEMSYFNPIFSRIKSIFDFIYLFSKQRFPDNVLWNLFNSFRKVKMFLHLFCAFLNIGMSILYSIRSYCCLFVFVKLIFS